MRCPECNQRNSVAANKCSECGFAFPKRPITNQTKVLAGFGISLVCLWGVALAVVPRLNDPTVALDSSAKALMNGTKTKSEDAEQQGRFDRALQAYLKQSGSLSSQDLTKRLQSILPASLFEVNVFDLPKGIKLVEIDAGMHASDYLLVKNANENKVIAVQGLDVFGSSTIINDPAGPVLVLVGHSTGQTEHRPQVKVYAMPAGELKDESDSTVPKFAGDGEGILANNKTDVIAKISLLSLARQDNLFDAKSLSTSQFPDEILRYSLMWRNGKYTLITQSGNGQLASLCKVARWANKLIKVPAYDLLLDEDGKRAMEAINPSADDTANSGFTLTKVGSEQTKKGPSRLTYVLSSPAKQIKVQLSRGNGGWQVVALNAKQGTLDIASTTPETSPPNSATPTQETAEPPAKESIEPKVETTQTPTIENNPTSEKTSPEPKTPPATEITDDANHQNESTSPSVETVPTPNNPITPSVLSKANLRKGPGTDFKPVAELAPDTPLQIIGKKDSWYKVRAGNKEGYVYGGLVNYKKPDAFTTATIKKDKPVNDDGNHSFATTHTGDRVVVLGGIHNNKYKVQLSNGKVGFVDKDAIDVTVDAPQSVP
jgi:hypothetical protein